MQLHFQGLVIGFCAFALIGLFHPIVIRCEYYFSARIWPMFLIFGFSFLVAGMLVKGTLSILLNLVGITCLWSIGELREQTKRVEKGWFPKNPRRK